MCLGSRKGTMKRFVMMVVVILSLLSCISAIRVSSSSSSSVMDARSRSHYHYHGGARSPWFDVGAQKRRVPTGSNPLHNRSQVYGRNASSMEHHARMRTRISKRSFAAESNKSMP